VPKIVRPAVNCAIGISPFLTAPECELQPG